MNIEVCNAEKGLLALGSTEDKLQQQDDFVI